MTDLKILKLKDVAARLGVSESTIKRMLRKAEIPYPKQVSEGRIGWLETDLFDWAKKLPEAKPISILSGGKNE